MNVSKSDVNMFMGNIHRLLRPSLALAEHPTLQPAAEEVPPPPRANGIILRKGRQKSH